MIDLLNESCIEEKVDLCFAKSKNMVKEMVRKIEKEKLSMLSSVPDFESFKFEENDEDHLFHNISHENHPSICAKMEYENFRFKEDICKDYFKSTQVDDDSMLETFCFEDNATLSFLKEIYIDKNVETCIDNHSSKSQNMVGEMVARTTFLQGPSMAKEILQHHEEVKKLDLFLYHEMEVNQVMRPTKLCLLLWLIHVQTLRIGIKIFRLDK